MADNAAIARSARDWCCSFAAAARVHRVRLAGTGDSGDVAAVRKLTMLTQLYDTLSTLSHTHGFGLECVRVWGRCDRACVVCVHTVA